MLLTIRGSEQLAAPDLIDGFVRYCVRKFVTNKRIYNNVKVDLIFTDEVHRRDRWGECYPTDEDIRKVPREFEVRVTRTGTPFYGQLLTLAHELKHVTQFVNGDLVFYATPHTYRWMGKRMTGTGSKLEYLEHPWELDARAWEKALVEGFCIENGLTEAEWLDASIL